MVPLQKVKEIVDKYESLEKELSSEVLTQNYLQRNQKNIQG